MALKNYVMDELLDINTTLKQFNSITTIDKGKEQVESEIVKRRNQLTPK